MRQHPADAAIRRRAVATTAVAAASDMVKTVPAGAGAFTAAGGTVVSAARLGARERGVRAAAASSGRAAARGWGRHGAPRGANT